ncbi:MAG: glutathione S-transferase family protein [Pseudomonadota bacterium]
MITIYGRTTSSNVHKVLWCCHDLKIEHKQVDIGGPFGGTDTQAFGQMNPNRTVPVMDHDGFTLWESNAIMRYLASQFGNGALYPADPQARARVDQWLDWSMGAVQIPIIPVFLTLYRTPEPERDMDAVNRGLAAVSDAWRLLEDHFAGGGDGSQAGSRAGSRAFICGEALSLADIALSTWVYRWHEMDIDRPDLPHLRAWRDRLATYDAYQTYINHPIV